MAREHGDPIRGPDQEVDAIYRSGAPTPEPAAAGRVAARVFQRLETRRNRLRWVRRWAAVTAAAAVLTGVLVLDPFSRSPGERLARPRRASGDRETRSETQREAVIDSVDREIPRLLRQLESDDPRLAQAAAGSLLEMDRPAAREALLDVLAVKPDSREVGAILEALARRTGTLRHWLAPVFELDAVAPRAFHLLGRARGRDFELFLAAALNSPSTRLRGLAVREAGSRSPDRGARLFWREWRRGAGRDDATSRGEPEVFLRAALEGLSRSTLGQLVSDLRRSSPATTGRSRRRAAAGAAPPPSEREFAAALAASRVREAWPLLEALLEKHGPDLDLIRAAGGLGDPRALPLLERWLYLADARGEAVVEALGAIPGEDSMRLLLSAHAVTLSGPRGLWPGFRDGVRRALLARRAEALAVTAARCREDPGRERAIASLTTLFPGEAVAVLGDLFGRAPRRVRPLVAGALARLGTPEAIRVLVDALDDPVLRRLAWQSLRRLAATDLGPSPDAWKRWLETRSAGAGPRTSGVREPYAGRLLLARHTTLAKEAP